MGPIRLQFPWNDELEELLKLEHKKGHSASAIARVLSRQAGITCSRNAVIGKIHRMGLRGDHKKRTTQPRPRTLARRRKDPAPRVLHNFSPTPVTMPAARARGALEAVMALEPHDCRWPVGDPQDLEFRFCGSPTSLGTSYCREHLKLNTRSKHGEPCQD